MKDGEVTGACAICGKDTAAKMWQSGFGLPGYARVGPDPDPANWLGCDVAEGDKVCYACCGKIDSDWMRTHDRIMLYLTCDVNKGEQAHLLRKQWRVSNWPGTLKMRASVSVYPCGHFSPFCGHMELRHAYFKDEHGRYWSGRSIGDWTEIIHCRRLKQGGRAEDNARFWLNRRIYPTGPMAQR